MNNSDRPIVAESRTAWGLEAAHRLGPSPRIAAIDMLRGLAVVLMIFDHARVYFSSEPLYAAGGLPAHMLAEVDAGLFAYAWITRWCAPIFVLLAGMGAALRLMQSGSKRSVAGFLVTRGLLLVALDLLVVPMVKWFYVDPLFTATGPLWAIGWSMVLLAGLVFLPVGVAAIAGLAIVAGHNAFDGVSADDLGAFRGLWVVLHEPGFLQLGDWLAIDIRWPIVPWVGVMACGFALAEVYRYPASLRRPMLGGLGANLLATFFILRSFNWYGSVNEWTVLPGVGRSVMSYVNCVSQPASLCFLLMTLGTGLIALAWLDGRRLPWLEKLAALGCVPLYCYFSHWLLLHVLAIGAALLRGQPLGWLASKPDPFTGRGIGWQEGFGYPLVVSILIGAVVASCVYWSSRRYAAVKFLRRPRWSSYF